MATTSVTIPQCTTSRAHATMPGHDNTSITKRIDKDTILTCFEVDQLASIRNTTLRRDKPLPHVHSSNRRYFWSRKYLEAQRYRSNWYRVVMDKPTLNEETPPFVSPDPPPIIAVSSNFDSPKNNHYRGEIILDIRGPPSEAVRRRCEEVYRNKEERRLRTMERRNAERLHPGAVKEATRQKRRAGLQKDAVDRRYEAISAMTKEDVQAGRIGSEKALNIVDVDVVVKEEEISSEIDQEATTVLSIKQECNDGGMQV